MSVEKAIAKKIALAQIASDAGKGDFSIYCRNCRTPRRYRYDSKVGYQLEAIRLIASNPRCGFSFYVTEEPDQNMSPSVLVYFDVSKKILGTRAQVSFHNPVRVAGVLRSYIGKGRRTHWNGIIGGSKAAVEALIEKYGLDCPG